MLFPTSNHYPQIIFSNSFNALSKALHKFLQFSFIYKPNFRKGDKLKWKGIEVVFPQFIAPPVYGHTVLALVGEYSIPECNIEKDDTVFDVGAHFGFFSYHAVQKGAKEVYAFEPNPSTFEILKSMLKFGVTK